MRASVFALAMTLIACSSAGLTQTAGSSGDPGATGDDSSGGDASVDGSSSSSSSSSSGGATPPSTNVKIIVEPSDSGSALVSAIEGATKSVHMTMYLLSSTKVINAIIAAKNKGLDVKVVLNQNFPMGDGSNASVESQLKGAGVSVVWAPAGYALTHEKCVILDGATAWIMTMNATQSSPTDNREYLAVDTDADDVAEAETIFQADYVNTNPSLSGKLVVAPTNARPRIQDLVNGAKTTIDIEGEELSDSTLVPLLAAKADAGVKIRVVLANTTPTSAQQTAVTTLKAHKVQVVSLATPYVHAKVLVADGTLAYVGSANFTAASLTTNRELGVIFSTSTEIAKVSSTIGSDVAAGSPL
ncbi:MAG TPA: phospholipase D-like domain-containing protein [Labilithrix sp.]